MTTYAGIGSRRAPHDILGLCTRIARCMVKRDWILRSGHAIGCDQAFELGACEESEVFLPWKDYESEVPLRGGFMIMPTVEALQMVPEYHPAPERLSMAVARLHARNCHIILGPHLNEPVDRVICWTADESRGGTSFGLRMARALDIPIHNLHDNRVRRDYEHDFVD